MSDLVIDSCVIISAIVREDTNHTVARSFFEAVNRRGDSAWVPVTSLWDIDARFVNPEKLGAGSTIVANPQIALKFIDITRDLFEATKAPTHLRSSDRSVYVVRSRIRGPDQILLSCALSKRCPLVTFDVRLLKEAHEFGVVTLLPLEYVEGKACKATEQVPTATEAMQKFADRYNKDS